MAARLRDRLGPDDPDTLGAERRLAVAYRKAGRPADAIRLLEHGLEVAYAGPRPDGPFTDMQEVELAQSLLDVGQAGKAFALLSFAVPRLPEVAGPDHPAVLEAEATLGDAYAATRRTAEGIARLAAVYERVKAKLGPDHPLALETVSRLVRARAAAGQTFAIVQLLEEAVPRARARFGPDHPTRIAAAGDLSEAYAQMRWAAATRAAVAEVVGLVRAHPRLAPAARGAALVRPGLRLLFVNDPAAAEPVFREALALQEQGRAGGRATGPTRAMLGAALLDQGRYEEAERHLLAGYAEMTRPGPDPAAPFYQVGMAGKQLDELYRKWGKPDQVTAWRKRLLAADGPTP